MASWSGISVSRCLLALNSTMIAASENKQTVGKKPLELFGLASRVKLDYLVRTHAMLRLAALLALLIPLVATADRYDDVVNSPERTEADTGRDALRQPATVLRTIGVDEGLTVLDMGAGGGYYSEMLARLVGDSGEVIMQNPSQLYEIFPNLKGSA